MVAVNRAVVQAEGSFSGISLLVVDQDTWARQGYKAIAEKLGFTVVVAESSTRALLQVASHAPDLVLIGPQHDPDEVVEVITRIRRLNPSIQIIAPGGTEASTDSESSDVLQADTLTAMLRKAAARLHQSQSVSDAGDLLPTVLVGQSSGVQKLRSIVSKLASSRQPVLISGEAGTGKEQLARAIHEHAPNRDLFVTVNCSSLVNEFLLHELSSPSNTTATLFLDQISDLPLQAQATLVRALESDPPPGTKSDLPRLSARLIASTRYDLEPAVRQGLFRRDLYLRLNAVMLRLAPLRERREDVPSLSYHLLDQISHLNRRRLSLSSEAIQLLVSYPWPGNLPELRAALQRAAAVSTSSVLQSGHFRSSLQQRAFRPAINPPANAILPLAEVEKQTILNALERLNGDKVATARLLGIGKTTLYRKLREYGIAETWISRAQQR